MTSKPSDLAATSGEAVAPRAASRKRPLRTDIQALRAIAVGLVILNHLWPERVSGGFVGVDVFFVISGFLITAHLLSEITRTGTLSLPKFYARRAKRLLPAALLVSLVSLVSMVLFMPAERWQRIGTEIFAATTYVENWVLAASAVDYSAQNEAATAAQHYWSLSVEEQFYLLWPLALLGLGWLVARVVGRIAGRARLTLFTAAALAVSIAVIAILSFWFSCFITQAEPSAAYFNTFGRVWEFMLGALVAIAAPHFGALARRLTPFASAVTAQLAGVLQLAGYALIAWAALTFGPQTVFPGPWALVPVLGTVLVIASGPKTPRWSPARLRAWRPIQYTGDISYSLYLWHWPLIVFAPFVLARDLRFIDRVAILGLSFVLAALTKHFVEDPGRTRLFAGARPRRTLIAVACSIAVIGAVTFGTSAWAKNIQQEQAAQLVELEASGCFGAASLAPETSCEGPFGPALVAPQGEHNAPWAEAPPECALAPEERQIYAAGDANLVECDFSQAAGLTEPAKRVWLVGDSHSEHWKAPVFDVARANGWSVSTTMQGGCPIVSVPVLMFLGDYTTEHKRASCLEWSLVVADRVVQDHPDLVLVSTFSAAEQLDDGSGADQVTQLASAFETSLVPWADSGAEVVLIRDAPVAGTELGPDCVLWHGVEDGGCVAPASEVLLPDPMVEAAAVVAHEHIRAVDLTDGFCLDEVCSGVIGGLPVYFDTDHVARSYARTLAPLFGERLGELLGAELLPPVAAG